MSVNKVILVGNVGKDPDVKYFDNDNVKANFSLATSKRGYTMANGTQVPERTEWHNVVCWRGLAQIVEKFVKKGSQLYVEGELRTRSYDDQNGVKRFITEVNAENIELLGRRGGSGNEGFGEQTDRQESSYQEPVDLGSGSETDDLPF